MTRQIRKDVILPNDPQNIINLDTIYQKLEAHHDRMAQVKARLDRERVEREQKTTKTDAQESQKLEATQERTDSEKRLDRSQEDYLTSRGLKTYPKLDQACNDYLSHRGLNPNYDSSACYKSNF